MVPQLLLASCLSEEHRIADICVDDYPIKGLGRHAYRAR